LQRQSRGCGFGAKNSKRSRRGFVSGAPQETAGQGDAGRGQAGRDEMALVVGPHASKRKAGGGFWAKTPKQNRRGSVSGAPCKTAGQGDAERQWAGRDETAAAVGPCVRKRKGGGRLWAKNPKPSRGGSVSGAPCEMAAQHDAENIRGWQRYGHTGGLGLHGPTAVANERAGAQLKMPGAGV
jgi:hypothetical protein